MLISLKKMHRRVAEIVRHCAMLGDHTRLLIRSLWKPAAGGDHGDNVFLGVLLVCVVGCVVQKVMVG